LKNRNFYSDLFNNSEVWHLNNLKQQDKSLLLTSSSDELKLTIHFSESFISFKKLNEKLVEQPLICSTNINNHLLCTKHLMCFPIDERTHLNFDQILMSRQTKFHVSKTKPLQMGMNALCNQFLNDQMP
jgi:hypothetical protein